MEAVTSTLTCVEALLATIDVTTDPGRRDRVHSQLLLPEGREHLTEGLEEVQGGVVVLRSDRCGRIVVFAAAAPTTAVRAHRMALLSAGDCLRRPEEGIGGRAQQLVLPAVGIPKVPREVSGRRGSCAFGTMNGIVSSSQTLQ